MLCSGHFNPNIIIFFPKMLVNVFAFDINLLILLISGKTTKQTYNVGTFWGFFTHCYSCGIPRHKLTAYQKLDIHFFLRYILWPSIGLWQFLLNFLGGNWLIIWLINLSLRTSFFEAKFSTNNVFILFI